ncbi:MAG TPA: alpha/beta hydrolase, partial [Solirubrobacteraceae bacterium]|nr:alpha/beta hydrolase [Solirubrobacteraceae bacterium]
RGDRAPAKRLAAGALLRPRVDPTGFNAGAAVAGSCEERTMPWPRTLPREERPAEMARRLAEIPPSAFAPFDPGVAAALSDAPQCFDWPAAADSQIVRGPLPSVPTLVLAGEADLRVPAPAVAALAERIPGARLIVAGDVGHGVLGEDPTACASRALAALLAGATPGDCAPAGLHARPRFARRLADVAGASFRARVVNAAVLTATDAINQAAMRIDALRRTEATVAFPGLRGGRARGDEDRVALDGAQWIRGLRVSGVARADGRHELRLRGLARGALRVRGTRYTGRIGGARVSGRLRLREVGAAGTPVGAML